MGDVHGTARAGIARGQRQAQCALELPVGAGAQCALDISLNPKRRGVHGTARAVRTGHCCDAKMHSESEVIEALHFMVRG